MAGPPQQIPESYFMEMYFKNPSYDDTLPSLVYEDNNGRIIGCLGVTSRRMSMNGRPVRVAITHDFMVEPSSRSTLAGAQLLKAFFSGPQDLSMAEANDVSRKVWEGLGGTTAHLYSIRWTRCLRPTRHLLSLLVTRGLPAAFAIALRPFCSVVDDIAAATSLSPFHQSPPRIPGEHLSDDTFLAWASTFTRGRSLRPEYDAPSLPWILDILARKEGRGTFRKVIVRGANQDILGWYLYYVNPGGVGEVVQIAAQDASIDEVLDQLFYDAWRQGVVALSGQLEPRFMREFSNKSCVFRDGSSWMLIHSHDPQLVQAIHRGDAFLTRLDGEWWINP